MRVAVLSCGAIVVSEKEVSWLFGAPKGISTALKEAGIEKPSVVFTTALRSPGYTELGEIMSFKEMPLTMNGMSAKPIPMKHGTDYAIDCGHARVLYSDRGDVSVEDTQGYDLAVIKNKHRADKFGEHVVTMPWAETEFVIKDHVVTPTYTEIIQLKVYSSMEDVPGQLKTMDGVSLSLDQANFIARVAKGSGEDGEENWAIAKSSFKKSYQKKDGKWVKRESTTKKEEELPETDGDAAEKQEAKVSKDSVSYKAAAEGAKEKCANCQFFDEAGSCSIVEGSIKASDTCDRFSPAKSSGPVGNELSRQVAAKEDEETEKEIDYSGRPVRKLGEMFVAKLHTTYNDISDKWLEKGYIDQEERIKIAGAIGGALKSLNKSFPEQVFNRIHPDDRIPAQFKELAPDVPDVVEDGFWFNVYKQDDDWRWASISSVASWDKQEELFTTKAMDWAIAFNKFTGYKGPLRFKHVPGLDGGDVDTQVRVGDFLFERGTFRDNPVGLAMQRLYKEEPGKWQISLGLAYAKEDLIDGQYSRAAIFERSMTEVPAHPNTSIIVTKSKEGVSNVAKIMTEEELKSVAAQLDMPVDEVMLLYERAMATQGIFDSDGFKEFALKETETSEKGGGKKGKKPPWLDGDDEYTDEEKAEMAKKKKKEDEEEAVDEKSLKEVVSELGDDEIAELLEVVEQVEKERQPPENEEVAALKSELDDVRGALQLQTKALADIVAALKEGGQQPRQDLTNAVAEVLSGLPRSQATGFVTQTKEEKRSEVEGMDDDQIYTMLKQIQKQVGANAKALPTQQNVYDLFTSNQLNK